MLSPDKATTVTLAALLLHNMLRELPRESYTPEGFIDQEKNGEINEGSWRDENISSSILMDLSARRNNNRSTRYAESIRESFADHFWGPGQLPWQWKMI